MCKFLPGSAYISQATLLQHSSAGQEFGQPWSWVFYMGKVLTYMQRKLLACYVHGCSGTCMQNGASTPSKGW